MLSHAVLALTATALSGGVPAETDRCTSLTGRGLSGGAVVSARWQGSGDTFATGVAAAPSLPLPRQLCRVVLHLKPARGSSIAAELWLPARDGWNGKLLAAGNGGFGGSLGDPMMTMRAAVARGYAAVGNDMGHRADDAGWFARDAAVTDFAWRADHVTTAAAKVLIATFYRRPARFSYFHGCSTGGREGLAAARRFPADYDGIVAGAPPADYSGLLAAGAWTQQRLSRPGAMPGARDLSLLATAFRRECGEATGRCAIDPARLACRPGDATGACLAPATVAAVRALYRGPGHGLPGLPAGAENMPDGWPTWIAGSAPRQRYFVQGAIGGLWARDPSWILDRFVLARDLPRLRAGFAGHGLDAPPDGLAPFHARGGRLIVYHGWGDAGVNPRATVAWRDRLVRDLGRRRADATLALFMVPGMGHCAGGEGPHHLATLDALEAWRERGVAPDRLIGTWRSGPPLAAALELPAGDVTATRPVCRYPRRDRLRAGADPARAESYACT